MREITRQAAAALTYLHDSPLGPLVHNDLKASNVLVRWRRTPQGVSPQVKLVDLDLAFPLQGPGAPLERHAQSVPGCCQQRLPTESEAHRAPECVACESYVGTASDVYALGQLLLGMLRPWRMRPFAFQELQQVATKRSLVWSQQQFGRLAGRLPANASRREEGNEHRPYLQRCH